MYIIWHAVHEVTIPSFSIKQTIYMYMYMCVHVYVWLVEFGIKEHVQSKPKEELRYERLFIARADSIFSHQSKMMMNILYCKRFLCNFNLLIYNTINKTLYWHTPLIPNNIWLHVYYSTIISNIYMYSGLL